MIVKLYAKKIISGERTLDNVPTKLLEDIKAELIHMGKEDLIQ